MCFRYLAASLGTCCYEIWKMQIIGYQIQVDSIKQRWKWIRGYLPVHAGDSEAIEGQVSTENIYLHVSNRIRRISINDTLKFVKLENFLICCGVPGLLMWMAVNFDHLGHQQTLKLACDQSTTLGKKYFVVNMKHRDQFSRDSKQLYETSTVKRSAQLLPSEDSRQVVPVSDGLREESDTSVVKQDNVKSEFAVEDDSQADVEDAEQVMSNMKIAWFE